MSQDLALVARNTAVAILNGPRFTAVVPTCPVQIERAEQARMHLAESHKARLRGCPIQAAEAYRKACALQRGDDDGFRLTNRIA